MANYVNYTPTSLIGRGMFNFDEMGIANYKLSGPIRVSVSDGFSVNDCLALGINSNYAVIGNGEINWSAAQKINIGALCNIYSQFVNLTFSSVIDHDSTGWKTTANPYDVGIAGVSDINISFSSSPSAPWSGISGGAADKGVYGVHNYTGAAGDVFINSNSFNNFTFDDISEIKQTLMHELGHSLGLSHPHMGGDPSIISSDYGALINAGFGKFGFKVDVPSDMYKEYFTIMSYNDQNSLPNMNAYTPMILDVISLSQAYGEGVGTHGAGNDTIVAGTAGYRTYFDIGGVDVIDTTAYSNGAYLNMGESISGAGHLVGVLMSKEEVNNTFINGGNPKNLRWFYGEYENAIGSSGVDLIVGNGFDNIISAGEGNDYVAGRLGADTIDGGLGADSMNGDDGSDTYVVDDPGDVVTETNNMASSGGIDFVYSYLTTYTLTNYVENGRILASGTANLTGNSLDNVLYAGTGANVLDGGAGVDTVSYAYGVTGSTGVTVDLRLATAQATGGSGSDTLKNVENLVGTGYDDSLIGGAAGNLLIGGSGNDILAGGSGSDILQGDSGNDSFNYSAASDSTATAMDIIRDLQAGDVIKFGGMSGVTRFSGNYTYATSVTATVSAIAANAGITNQAVFFTDASDGYLYVKGAGTGVSFDGTLIKLAGKITAPTIDQLVGVSSANIVNGTSGNDDLTGTSGSDILYGMGGNDILDGASGNDTLDGGLGDDDLYGGLGDDSLVGGDGDDYAVYISASGPVSVNLQIGKSAGADGIDTLTGVENLFGSNYHDSLTGDARDNLLFGLSGNDTLIGGNGDDIFTGGLGDDVLTGGDGQFDAASYISSTGAVQVNLGTGKASGADGSDSLSGIERVYGSDFNDLLTGDSVSNRLLGRDGNDTLTGGMGSDILQGDSGNDTFNYSVASDSTAAARDTIIDLQSGDVIKFNGMAGVALYSGSYAYTTSVTATLSAISANAGVTNQAVFFTNASDGYLYIKGAGTGVSFDGTLIKLAGKTTAPTIDQLVGVSSANTINGTSGNDSLTGTSGDDVINGYAGNDTLKGVAGADTMVGGDGSDTYYVDNAGDIVTETNATASSGGIDVVQSSLAAYTLSANVENGRIRLATAANLTGNGLDNILYAGTGNNVLDGGAGIDTVSYAYGITGATGMTLDLRLATAQATGGSGSDTLKNVENLIGSVNNDSLIGSSAANRLEGGAGNDSLNGYTGADTMIGGDGSDTYYVDNAGDIVTETNATASSGGIDVVQSSLAAYTLTVNVENGRIRLTTAANLTGNGLDNILFAGTGNNVLDGGAGIDTVSYANGITGATGVTLDLRLSTAQATGGSGSDTLKNVENLIGSANNDSLIGSSAANRLEGGAGNDSLNGYTGADTLVGGNGSDTYYVDNVGDIVTEANATASTGGIDVVQSSLAAYTLTANVENGRIRLTTAANLTGNGLDNILYAGAGNNVLDGVSGVDTVSYVYATAAVSVSLATSAAQATGSSGSDTLKNIDKLTGSNFNDTLIGDANANTLDGLALNDSLSGGGGNDLLLGGEGNDLLIGGLGKDTLTGGAGNDTFIFKAIGETTTSSTTCDVITDFARGQDKIDLSAIDANSATASVNEAFTNFIGSGSAFSAAGQLRINGNVLYGNIDTDSAAEFAIVLTGITALSTADFVV